MLYKIRSSLLPADKSYITQKPIEKPVHELLSLYDKGQDLTDSPFIKAKQWMHHVFCVKNGNTIESAYERQQQIIDLYENIKRNGFNGSKLYIWFDKEGNVKLGDGFHRISILHYLNQDVMVNCETNWRDMYDGQFHTDFPLEDILQKEAPQGKWTYQPVDDPRLKDWKVDRFDAEQRLNYILPRIKGRKILDVGCSEGYYARELAKRGYEVTAIDRSAGLIAAARYLTTIANLKVDYHVVKDWGEFVKDKYDTILFLAIIHNDMKTIGIEKGIEKLGLLKDKADVIFMEVPNNHNERGWGRDPYPKYDFHKPESIKQIEDSLGMKVTDRFNGRRVIYMLESDAKTWLTPYRKHYEPLFRTLGEKPCKNIMEIGVFDGESAAAMIKQAAKLVPEDEISFYGFDLFEEMTPQLRDEEWSFQTNKVPKKDDVQKYLETKTKAKITLIKGNTRETLVKNASLLPPMDFIYIDGGHTIETTRNDWYWSSRLLKEDGIAYFDDYCDEMPFIGSYFIKNELPPNYVAEVQPETDIYPRKFGRLKAQLLKVEKKRTQVSRPTDHFRFHLLGMPHSKTVKDWGPCAFTQLVYRFSQMMHDMGHEVYHYGTEGSDLKCTEHITVLSEESQKQAYGDWSPYKQLWIHNGSDPAYKEFRKNAIQEVNKRKEPHDILLITNGHWLNEVAQQTGIMAVEPFVGYLGCCTKRRVFPSYTWMHHIYGLQSRKDTKENFVNGNWYDAVIPHFFDPADHTFSEKKEDYFFYFGRLIQRKGIHIAVDITKRIGAKLIVAGQPLWPDRLEESLKHVGCLQPHVEYKGVLTMKEIDEIKKKAKASFVPSLYMEPFGLVVIESLLSGTPVITTDWGSFPEIVPQGEVGYRCRTADDFIWACNNIDKINSKRCREYAVENFSMERIGKSYQEYFTKTQDAYRGGWYALHPERTELDWLRRY